MPHPNPQPKPRPKGYRSYQVWWLWLMALQLFLAILLGSRALAQPADSAPTPWPSLVTILAIALPLLLMIGKYLLQYLPASSKWRRPIEIGVVMAEAVRVAVFGAEQEKIARTNSGIPALPNSEVKARALNAAITDLQARGVAVTDAMRSALSTRIEAEVLDANQARTERAELEARIASIQGGAKP